MNDSTERQRRMMADTINSHPLTKKDLQALYGDVYTTEEMDSRFEFIGFAAPFVVLRRLSDGVKGSMLFQHHPRLYFGWKAHPEDDGHVAR